MAKFEVLFTPDALEDILSSYEWGIVSWGDEAAEKWLRELYSSVYQRLTVHPKSCVTAPESEQADSEVRQLLFLRYRILFEINKNHVVVLRVVGPHTSHSGLRSEDR